MGILYITEYSTMGQTGGAGGQMPQEPAAARQQISIDVLHVESAALNAKTRFVRLHCDVICKVLIDISPNADPGGDRMAANQTEYRAVPEGGNYKVSVVSAS